MSVRYERDDARRRVVVTVQGPFAQVDFLAVVERQQADHAWAYGILYDLRGMTGHPTAEELRQTMSVAAQTDAPRGPVAVVTTDPASRAALQTVERELGNLAQAIAAGGQLEPLLVELQARQARREQLVTAITAHERILGLRLDRKAIAQQVRRHIEGWHELLSTKQVQDGRGLGARRARVLTRRLDVRVVVLTRGARGDDPLRGRLERACVSGVAADSDENPERLPSVTSRRTMSRNRRIMEHLAAFPLRAAIRACACAHRREVMLASPDDVRRYRVHRAGSALKMRGGRLEIRLLPLATGP